MCLTKNGQKKKNNDMMFDKKKLVLLHKDRKNDKKVKIIKYFEWNEQHINKMSPSLSVLCQP